MGCGALKLVVLHVACRSTRMGDFTRVRSVSSEQWRVNLVPTSLVKFPFRACFRVNLQVTCKSTSFRAPEPCDFSFTLYCSL